MRRNALFAGLVCLAVISAYSNASAAVLRQLYLDDLADSAVVVHATIVSARSEWNATRTVIHTIYTARAHQYLKGLLSQTFEFRQRGGQVDNMVLDASGSPTFQAGEEVVLFLWTDGPSGAYQCIGFEQGVLRVSEQFGIKVVNRSIPVRNTVGAEPSTAGSTPVVRLEGTSLALREVLMQVSVALARAEASKSPQKEPR